MCNKEKRERGKREKKKKKFDCVTMKRRGAERIYEATKNMTTQQQLEYWQQRTGELRKKQDEG